MYSLGAQTTVIPKFASIQTSWSGHTHYRNKNKVYDGFELTIQKYPSMKFVVFKDYTAINGDNIYRIIDVDSEHDVASFHTPQCRDDMFEGELTSTIYKEFYHLSSVELLRKIELAEYQYTH